MQKSLHYESRMALGSLYQNIGNKGVYEELFANFNLFPENIHKIVKYADAQQAKSRKEINQKKKKRISNQKALKKYAHTAASSKRIPSYKNQNSGIKQTGTYLDIEGCSE